MKRENDLSERLLESRTLSVSELIDSITHTLEDAYFDVEVEGEISSFNAHRSGHYYFSLSDPDAQLDAVMFRNRNIYLTFKPEIGMKVLARGKITVYKPQGRMQLTVDFMEQVGVGAALIALRRLAEKLQKEGLFDPDKKKPLPALPDRIGIVTSPSGAAIRDILNVIRRRFADLHIIIYPAHVQGESAVKELKEGIEYFDSTRTVDVIIITRGGGSPEDLIPFNDENLARSIFRCELPVVSAVGHQIDTTISDLVADLRAPTPSAAAELIVEKKSVLKKDLANLSKKLAMLMRGRIQLLKAHVLGFKRSRLFTDPYYLYKQESQRLDNLNERMVRSIKINANSAGERAQKLEQLLESYNPLSVLSRGYSITLRDDGKEIITSSSQVKKGEKIISKLSSGRINSIVQSIKDKE